MFCVVGKVFEERFNVRRHPVLNEARHGRVGKRWQGWFDDFLDEKTAAAGDGDEMVDASCFMRLNDRFASVATWTVPAVGWLERVVHHEAEGTFIEDAGVEHLAVARFKHTQFLVFARKQHHGQDEERQWFLVHDIKSTGKHLNMCSQGC